MPANGRAPQALKKQLPYEIYEVGHLDLSWASIALMLVNCVPEIFIRDRRRALASMKAFAHLAGARGDYMVGLGSFTASVTRGGQDILDEAREYGLVLNHGDDFSCMLAVESLRRLNQLGLNLATARVGVVGAVGLMGAGFIRILQHEIHDWVAIVRDEYDPRVLALAEEVATAGGHMVASSTLSDLGRLGCDVVYVAHNDPTSRLAHSDLREGSIVLDACIPPALPHLSSNGIIVAPVGCGILPHALVQGGDLDLCIGSRTSQGTLMYGCMIGCLLAAYRDEKEHRIGSIDPAYGEELLVHAKALDITPQPFPSEDAIARSLDITRRQRTA